MITLHSKIEEIASLWQQLEGKVSYPTPFSTYQWHELYLHHRSDTYQPFYLSIDTEIIAPFVKDQETIYFSGNKEVADYLDLVGSETAKLEAWKQLLPWLKAAGIKKLVLYNVAESSKTHEFFKTITGAQIEQEDTTPRIALPSDWETYVSSLARKHRHELRRKIRKFEEAFPTARVTTSNANEQHIATLIRLMKLNPEKNTFLTPTMTDLFAQLPQAFASHLQIHELTIDEVVAASVLAFTYGKTYLLYNSGFDEATYSGSGFYLKAKSIEYAITQGISDYNFLQGSERYKYELGGIDHPIYTISDEL